MNFRYVYFIILLYIMIVSCNSPQQEIVMPIDDKSGVMTVSVTHPAGDRLEGSDDYLALPMNVASINNKQVIIISDRIKRNESVEVKTIGAIRVLDQDSLKTYVISIPNDLEMRTINADGFDEFSTVHSSAKWIIEQYLVNRKGNNKVSLKSWENEKTALNYLLK